MDSPNGLAFDSAGNLYATSYLGNKIHKFTPNGVGSIFSSNVLLSRPFGVAFDSAGNLYATSSSNDVIVRFPPSPGFSIFADSSDGLNDPLFMALTDNAGVPLKLANQVPEPTT